MTLTSCKAEAKVRLAKGGIENSALEASILVRHYASLDAVGEILHAQDELPEALVAAVLLAVDKRLQHIPMSYITKTKEFYGLSFFVNESVLIPRPDTETLVETGINLIREERYESVLDLCTGSGCVGISIAHECPIALTLSDISPSALAVAKRNATSLLSRMPRIITGSLFEPFEGEKFDLIVSNPPYLTTSWYDETEADVKAEPITAFIGFDEDGLCLIREIIAHAGQHLSQNGTLALECDYRQTQNCVNLMKDAGFSSYGIIKDLFGKERVVWGKGCILN